MNPRNKTTQDGTQPSQNPKPETGNRTLETAVPGHRRLSSGLWVPTEETIMQKISESHQPKPWDRYMPRDGELSLFEFALKTKRPLMLIGPPHTAKTLFAETMAAMYNLPFVDVPFAKGCTLSAQVGSVNFYTAENNTMHMVADDGPVVTAVRAPSGAILYLDEIRKAEGDQLSFYASLTDGRRRITVPETKEHLELHPDLVVVASYNPGILFSRAELEPAIARRFLTLRFDYLDAEATESRIMKKMNFKENGVSVAIADDEPYWQLLKNRLKEEKEMMEKRARHIKACGTLGTIAKALIKNIHELREKAERGDVTVKEQPGDGAIDIAVEMIMNGFSYSTSLLTSIINPILSDLDPEWNASSQAMETTLKSALPPEFKV